MKRAAAFLFCVLWITAAAYAQPDDGPGMARPGQAVGGPVVRQRPMLELGPARDAINLLNNPAEKVDLSSPEATVRSFIWAFNNEDLGQARLCILNAASLEKLKPLQELLKGQIGKYAVLLIKDLHSYNYRDEAIVTFWLNSVMNIKVPNFLGSSERLHLRLVDGTWLIMPQQEAKKPVWDMPPRPIAEDVIDFFTAKMTDAAALQSDSQFHQCQSQLKQIALGALQYTQDFDETFPSHEEWQKEIQPYVHNTDILRCPLDAGNPNSYSFNKEMGNFLLAQVRIPARTILMYEGKDRKFEFRHQIGEEKLTNILFSDGHVKSFSGKALEAALKDQSVRWTP